MVDNDDLGFVPDEQDDLGFVAEETSATLPTEKTLLAAKAIPSIDTVTGAGSSALNTLSDLLAGVVQGGAASFGDELLGGTMAVASDLGLGDAAQSQANAEAIAKLSNERALANAQRLNKPMTPDMQVEVPSLYETARDVSREGFAAAEQRSPISFTAGQVSGGLLSALAPIGAAGAATSTLGKIGTTAAIGAAGAGLEELGSQQELTMDTPIDVVNAATIGGVAGGTLGALGQAAGKGVKSLGKTELGRDLSKAFTAGRDGLPIVGKEAVMGAEQNLVDLAGKFRQESQSFTKKASEIKKTILKGLDEKGVKQDLTSMVREINTSLQNDKTISTEAKQRLGDFLTEIQTKQNYSPLEVEALFNQIRALEQDFTLGPGRGIVRQLRAGVTNLQDELSSKIRPLNKLIVENDQLTEALTRQEILGNSMDAADLTRLNERVGKMLGQVGEKGESTRVLDQVINKGLKTDSGQTIRPLTQVNPKFAKPFEANVTQAAENLNLAKKASKPVSVLSPGASTETLAIRGANLLGEIVPKDGSTAATAAKVVTANPKFVADRARKMGMNGIADKLDQIALLPDAERNQKVFSLMQQPSFRKLFTPEDEK